MSDDPKPVEELQEQPAPEETTLEVNDLDTFIRLLASWHGKRVARLEALLQTPEGTEVSFGEEPAYVLEGDRLKSFRLGVAMALSQLGTLPFAVEFEEPSPDAKPH